MSGTYTYQDVFNAGFEARQEGTAFGIVLASLEQVKHAQQAAGVAAVHIRNNMPKLGQPSADAFRKHDLAEIASQFRALADELDAAARQAAPHLREVA